MGLTDWFQTFCSNITVKDSASISMRYRAITKRLNTDFWGPGSDTAHSLYVGSYGRNTAIDGLSDIDMIFELPNSVYDQYNSYTGNGQSALLQAIRNSLIQTYSSTDVGADGQVVVIPFKDGITFEVVPVFLTASGYIFPDSNGGGSWKNTKPRLEIDAIRDRNADCNNNLIPLCRMMRIWKKKYDVSIKSVLIDTLAYQFMAEWKYKDKSFLYYDFMCRDFFLFMANQPTTQIYWLAPGSNQRIYNILTFQDKAKKCYDLALEAIERETSNPKREWAAKYKWREIFGTAFPN
ncbi:MAG: nucleotidyltransferase [bacterium]